MSKLEKAIVGAIDEVEVIFKSEGVVLSKTVRKFGRLKRLKINDKITIFVPPVNATISVGAAKSKTKDKER